MENKCSKCGGKAEISVKIFEGGFPKEIFYCRRCLKETLRSTSKKSLHMDLVLWSMVNSRPKITVKMELKRVDAVSFLNESVKSTLGVELREEEKVKYEISRLRDAISKAIKNENYELAGILQREIKRLRSSFKKAK